MVVVDDDGAGDVDGVVVGGLVVVVVGPGTGTVGVVGTVTGTVGGVGTVTGTVGVVTGTVGVVGTVTVGTAATGGVVGCFTGARVVVVVGGGTVVAVGSAGTFWVVGVDLTTLVSLTMAGPPPEVGGADIPMALCDMPVMTSPTATATTADTVSAAVRLERRADVPWSSVRFRWLIALLLHEEWA